MSRRSVALTVNQIAKAKAKEAKAHWKFSEGVIAYCQHQLALCLQRSVIKIKFAFGNDPRYINLHDGHPWLDIHRVLELMRCDITIFCRQCGGSSSGNRTITMKGPCNPAIASPLGKSRTNKHHNMMTAKLMLGECPNISPK